MRILFDFETRDSDPGGISKAQITLRAAGLGRNNFNFSRTLPGMIVKRLLLCERHTNLP
jgi:hypothetical protein